MHLIEELMIIMLVSLSGELVSHLLPFTFPSAIISLFLMLLLLLTGIIKEEKIEKTGNFFLSNMAFFFVPSGVNLINNLDEFLSSWIIILLITIISLFTTFFAAAKSVEFCEYLIERKRRTENA